MRIWPTLTVLLCKFKLLYLCDEEKMKISEKDDANVALKSVKVYSALKMENLCNKELLHKCDRGNEIAPLWHKCQAK